jgi:hypothetical protein
MSEFLKGMQALAAALHQIPDSAWDDPPPELCDATGLWLMQQLRDASTGVEAAVEMIVKHVTEARSHG